MMLQDQQWNHNPFDAIDIARDLVRRDEAERLFALLNDVQKSIKTALNVDGTITGDYGLWTDPAPISEADDRAYTRGVYRGLDVALNELDTRIGVLRDRWR